MDIDEHTSDEYQEVLPPDPFAFPEKETDVDLEKDNPQVRLGLYYALKDTRSEPGLSLERTADVIMNALSREEVSSLIRELQEKHDR